MSDNILLYELFTIDEFLQDKSKLANYDKELNYYPITTITENTKSEDIVNIKVYQSFQLQYIKSYINDFYDFFIDVFAENDNETIDETIDIEQSQIQYKKDLYTNRMKYINQFKESLFKYIIYLKKFKGTFDYIFFVTDLYIRLKYGEQLYTNNEEKNDIQYSGFLQINQRYKIYSGKYQNYTKDNIFISTSNDAIVDFSVIPQFSIDIFKIDKYSYQISTILTNEKWENILKDIIHPLGWNYKFLSMLDVAVVHTNFLAEKERRILYLNDNNRVLNANYSLNNTSYFRKITEYGNICLSELGCK